MKLNRILCLMFATVVLAGCTGSDIDTVKSGTMNGYQTTTVGAAFDASFGAPKWSEFKGEKGERVVEFTGEITAPLFYSLTGLNIEAESIFLEAYAAAVLPEPEFQQVYEGASGEGTTPKDELRKILFEAARAKIVGATATFQWIVTPDGKSFSLSYVDTKPWGVFVHNRMAQIGYGYKDMAIIDAIYN